MDPQPLSVPRPASANLSSTPASASGGRARAPLCFPRASASRGLCSVVTPAIAFPAHRIYILIEVGGYAVDLFVRQSVQPALRGLHLESSLVKVRERSLLAYASMYPTGIKTPSWFNEQTWWEQAPWNANAKQMLCLNRNAARSGSGLSACGISDITFESVPPPRASALVASPV